jgi:uncharacterized membrane protein YdjX (TVP38/TMEM64 family)
MLRPEPDVVHAQPASTRSRTWLRLGVLLLVIALAVVGAHRIGLLDLRDPERLAQAVRDARSIPALPFLFVAAYALANSFGLPGTIFTLAGGAIFGTALGSLLNWLGATIGACGAYALALSLGSDAVRRFLGGRSGALDALATRSGFATVFRLRLIPVVPFNALNFASGLARVPFRAYLFATALGILPATVIYTYFADSLIAGAAGARERALVNVAIAGALLIALSFAPVIVRRFTANR